MERVYTVNEAAQYLALKPSTIRKMIFQRRIPKVKLGRAVRVRQADLEAILKNGIK